MSLQSGAQLGIKRRQFILLANSFAVRWIRHHDAVFGQRLSFQHIRDVDRDTAAKAGFLQITTGGAHRFLVDVVTANIQRLGRFDPRLGGGPDIRPVERREALQQLESDTAIQPWRASPLVAEVARRVSSSATSAPRQAAHTDSATSPLS